MGTQHQVVKPHPQDSGIYARLVSVQSPQTGEPPVCAAVVTMGTGAAQDPINKKGISHVIEHIYCRHLKSNSGLWSEAFFSTLRYSHIRTHFDHTVFIFYVPEIHLAEFVRFIIHFTTNPSVDQSGFDLARVQVLEELRQHYRNPVVGWSYEKLYHSAFRDHPYQWYTFGRTRFVRHLQFHEVLQHYQVHHQPSPKVITFLATQQALKRVGESLAFADLEKQDPPVPIPTVTTSDIDPLTHFRNSRSFGASQGQVRFLAMLFRIPVFLSPQEWVACDFLSHLLAIHPHGLRAQLGADPIDFEFHRPATAQAGILEVIFGFKKHCEVPAENILEKATLCLDRLPDWINRVNLTTLSEHLRRRYQNLQHPANLADFGASVMPLVHLLEFQSHQSLRMMRGHPQLRPNELLDLVGTIGKKELAEFAAQWLNTQKATAVTFQSVQRVS